MAEVFSGSGALGSQRAIEIECRVDRVSVCFTDAKQSELSRTVRSQSPDRGSAVGRHPVRPMAHSELSYCAVAGQAKGKPELGGKVHRVVLQFVRLGFFRQSESDESFTGPLSNSCHRRESEIPQ